MKKNNNVIVNLLSSLVKTKNPDELIQQSQKAGLSKNLTVFDLIILGIGAIVGSGIFAVVGIAAAGQNDSPGAGPAIVISMCVAAFACVFSALCYSEFAAMMPVAGGAYTYTFATLGEFGAWLVGWVLMLEYAIGAIAVACAWSNHLIQFLKGFSHCLPAWVANPPVWLVNDAKTAVQAVNESGLDAASVIPHIGTIPVCINLPAIFIITVITAILIRGTKDSTKMAGIMVAVKLAVIGLFVLVGMFFIKPANWTPFAPNGFEGIFMGAFIIFFAYIGFDAIATTAEETKNPQKDIPIGIIGSLLATTIIYVSVALVLTGMHPTSGVAIPEGFLKAPMAYVMSLAGQNWTAGLISLGSLAGLTSVLLVMELAATRILYAMSRDNFISKRFCKLHPTFKTPHVLTWTVGAICVLGTFSLDLKVAAELCNFGTFTSFIIVCVAVLIFRKTDPKRYRPFKVPFSPVTPLLGIICCGGLMIYSMQFLTKSTVLFPIWLLMGCVIYFSYGYKKNREIEANKAAIETQKEALGDKNSDKAGVEV